MPQDFIKAEVSTLKVKVDVDADEVLVQSGNLPTGRKRTITIGGFKRDGTLDEANLVFGAVLGNIAGTTYDSVSATKFITERIGDSAYTDVVFTLADIQSIMDGSYQLSGRNVFTNADIQSIFSGSYQLSGRNTFTAADFANL